MDIINTKKQKPIKLLNDGFNEVIFKPNTKKVVIGINIHSWNGSKYRTFKCDSKEKAIEISKDYINKKSRVKWYE